ncbi:MAG TPA: hypothetical protein VFQ75_10025 [Candidatus Limnocylindrales bacterium]|nr:hypothetical protein [Candidatus Limnocylindrales bacterium]
MMIVTGMFTALSRLMGGVATMTVGWAVVLLFGRVPQEKRTLLSFIALGSLAWLGAVIAVSIPGIGAFVVAAVPRPGFVALAWLSWIVLGTAVLMPLAIGAATVSIVAPADRPKGRAFGIQLLRGYLYAPVMAFTILFLAVVAIVRKVRSFQHGWQSDHLPVIIKGGKYDAVVDGIEAALREAGMPVRRQFAPRVLEVPPRLLAAVSGIGIATLIPDRLVELRVDGLAILVYPSDIALLGPEKVLARARAVMAQRLAFSDAYLTQTKETEEIEDKLAELVKRRARSAEDFAPVDEKLGKLVIPYGDWETLYRLRLQAERGQMPGGEA